MRSGKEQLHWESGFDAQHSILRESTYSPAISHGGSEFDAAGGCIPLAAAECECALAESTATIAGAVTAVGCSAVSCSGSMTVGGSTGPTLSDTDIGTVMAGAVGTSGCGVISCSTTLTVGSWTGSMFKLSGTVTGAMVIGVVDTCCCGVISCSASLTVDSTTGVT